MAASPHIGAQAASPLTVSTVAMHHAPKFVGLSHI
jgi:hypothetical protein